MAVDKIRNMEHSETSRNIPEHEIEGNKLMKKYKNVYISKLIFQKVAKEIQFSSLFLRVFFLAFPIEFYINKYIDYKGH